ncbi:transaldolase [Candidatus Aerophobetes bacterium]|nr:transaldolase [Candidatus Aerophobetes bacterium]
MAKAENLSVFEKLQELNPEAEIWWDSSPLIYEAWAKELISSIKDEDKKEKIKKTLFRFYNSDNPEKSFFRGVTTNPPLSLDVLKYHTDYWRGFVQRVHRISPNKKAGEIFWQMYKEIIRKGAELFIPVFESSNYKHGYISAQLDPRDRENFDFMLEQAEELASLSPNIMIKVPGTKEGYELIKVLTSRGIPTNNTLSFMIPQFAACAKAVKEGVEIAKKNAVDLTTWRSVITFMSSRFTTLGSLEKEAKQKGIELSEEDMRWVELAIMKKAYLILKEGNYPSKMLLCSMRISPTINGEKHCWHLEKLAGAGIVFTCPPKFIAPLLLEGDHIQFSNQIDEPAPDDVLQKLLNIEYFARGYDEKGYEPEEFNFHPALLNTAKQFSQAANQMINFVKETVPQLQV